LTVKVNIYIQHCLTHQDKFKRHGNAWFFGSSLSKKLGIPVGLIYTAWGGTAAEVWTPVESLEELPELDYFIHHYSGYAWWPGTAGVLYNAMIHPLINYTIKGAIWYQGESNRMDYKLYPTLMNTMITSWRKAWGIGDFPFYYVQIAPYLYEESNSGALLREAQLKCLSIPNTGMAVTMDIAGDINDIHPKNKLDVGKRLALWALTKTYGLDMGSFSGPVYKDYKIDKKNVSLEFIYADEGLKIIQTIRNNFMIAGADKVFYPATVKVQGNKLIVASKKVKNPLAVRYAFLNTSVASLFNGAGLPASSFRTDNWDVETK
jgi:sialate O-acetylesterase